MVKAFLPKPFRSFSADRRKTVESQLLPCLTKSDFYPLFLFHFLLVKRAA